ncbi:MAG: cupin domain-containing protein [Opitutales bacterium]
MKDPLNEPELETLDLKDDGVIPNSRFPLVHYRQAVRIAAAPDPASIFETLFSQNQWTGSWRNGVYSYHHYHSKAHEVLGVYSGSAQIRFGGESGRTVKVQAGDAVVIPAGVAHKKLEASSDFAVVGAYPTGQSAEIREGKKEERPAADKELQEVPRPALDPLYGESGPLLELW